jgi:GNAT superfamily N-acetyltransferase
MQTVQLPASPIPTLRTLDLVGPAHEKLLQAFFEANPAYFLAVNGEPPGPDEAHNEIHEPPPAGWPFTKKWVIGYADESGELVAVANVITDLLAYGVWHIGLLILASARHGSGEAKVLHQGLQDWALANGASWLRLGVVQGNARAERFWASAGYVETRIRPAIQMGKLSNHVRVMVKPLAGGSVEEYLSLVPRDRSELAV